jgi:hypothetical protein
MGKKSKTPKVPDYSGAANQTLAASQKSWADTLQANRPDQITDTGSIKWTIDPTTGRPVQTTSLNPAQNNLLNSQTANQQQLAGMIGQNMSGYDTSQIDLSGAPAIPGTVDYSQAGAMPTVGGYNQQVIDSLRALQDPTIQRTEDATRARMAAMGMGMGTGRANQTQEEIMGQSRNDADLKAILAGIEQGNTEFNQGMDIYKTRAGQLDNNFTQGMLGHTVGTSDILNQQKANLGQLQGLMGLIQSPSGVNAPGFSSIGQYDVPNYADLAGQTYNAQLNKTNAKNADKSNLWGGIGQAANTIGSIFSK